MGLKHKILVADDEPSVVEVIFSVLDSEGYEVLVAKDGQEALDLFAKQAVDLLLLDIIMPVVDGLTVCRRVRETSRVPIIMLTALGSERDIVRGLAAGADDYLTKPFSPDELLARVDAVLRRVRWQREEDAAEVMRIGELEVDVAARRVMVDGKEVHLTPMEYELLRYLVMRAGRVISKETLMREVWGYREVVGSLNLVEVTVRRLRVKLGLSMGSPPFIITVRGVGYRFITEEEWSSWVANRSNGV